MNKATESSEFWVTAFVNIVAAVVAILAARGLVTGEEGELWVQLAQAVAAAVAPLVMAIVSKAYIEGRTALRVASLK